MMEMEQDFDNWNNLKKQINKRVGEFLYHAGDIWWCELGKNIGHEQDGKGVTFERPVLVVKDLISMCVSLFH
jgi:mRNA interferase MazF